MIIIVDNRRRSSMIFDDCRRLEGEEEGREGRSWGVVRRRYKRHDVVRRRKTLDAVERRRTMGIVVRYSYAVQCNIVVQLPTKLYDIERRRTSFDVAVGRRAGIYMGSTSTQRQVRERLDHDKLSWIHIITFS